MDSFEEERRAMVALPGWRIRRSFSGLARTYRLFLANDRELRSYLAASAEPPRVLELWDINNARVFEEHLDEVDRLFHNYLGAATTLRDHTRNVWRAHVEPPAAAEYQDRVDATFAKSPLAQFVQRLRNYTLHQRLPIARGRLTMRGDGFRSSVYLDVETLMQWEGWSVTARAYLGAADEVDLGETVKAYTSLVSEFNDWFGYRFAELHLEALEEVFRAEAALAETYGRRVEAFEP